MIPGETVYHRWGTDQMSECSGEGCTDPSHRIATVDKDKGVVTVGCPEKEFDLKAAKVAATRFSRYNKTPYDTATVYRSRNGAAYRADECGTLRRVDGGKLSKAERKAAKREAVLELKRGRL